ncbi:MAG: Na+/H+ antiporter NhaC, partial [Oscillospiraceae bacterium]
MSNEAKTEKAKSNPETDKNQLVEFRPSFGAAVIIVAFLVISMSASIFLLHEKMHIAMLCSLAVTILVLTVEKCPWKKIENAIIHGGQLMI